VAFSVASSIEHGTSPQKASKLPSFVAVVMVIIGVIGLRILINRGSIANVDPNAAITGKLRETFLAAGMKTCMNKQANDPETKALFFSTNILTRYCSCYMNTLADATTNGDLRASSTAGSVPAAMQRKIKAASASCIVKMQRSLLGAGK
jgi:hypothetical protein